MSTTSTRSTRFAPALWMLWATTLMMAAPPAGAAVAVGPLTWSDEFNGIALNPTKWMPRASGQRNDGILTRDAVSVGGGVLTIKTYTQAGRHYSGMISSQSLILTGFEQRYGYFEARMKFSTSPGMWSAFWVQSPSMGTSIGDPATAGVEMDVVEHRARCASAPAPPSTCSASSDIADRAQQALIWNGYGSASQSLVRLSDPLTGLGNGSWHTWALQWAPDAVTYLYDGVAIWSSTGPISQRGEYIILSSEVDRFFAGAIPPGGYGSRSATTTNVQVDYVRVYALV